MIKGVTLRGLEVFEALAATGSVAQAAATTGLSQPAVNQQTARKENDQVWKRGSKIRPA